MEQKSDKKSDLIRLTGLWTGKTKSGQPQMSGSLGNGRILILPNNFKEDGKNQPDYILFMAPKQEQEQDQGMKSQPQAAPSGFHDDIPF